VISSVEEPLGLYHVRGLEVLAEPIVAKSEEFVLAWMERVLGGGRCRDC
jgi:hypothetical protein